MATAKQPAFKIPKTLALCADLLYQTREKRLALQKDVDELASQESQLRDHIINNLPKSDATGVAGKIARATIVMKTVVEVEDWDALYKHVKKTGEFELLQKRVASKAVEERWDNKKKVPGLKPMQVPSVSLNKVG